MVFGEIIEPTTRALIVDEEEFVDYPEQAEEIVWDGCNTLPEEISTLTVIESSVLLEIFQKLVRSEKLATLRNTGVEIYKTENDKFVIASKLSEGFTYGEIVEVLIPWISKAESVYCLTSSPSQKYINVNQSNKSDCLIRTVNYKQQNKFNCEVLESPNLVTGLGASVLSYCVHVQKPCSLYIAYLSSVQFDSRTVKPILELIQQLNAFEFKSGNIQMKLPQNNLYM